MTPPRFCVLGLMSGTSLDGIDAALIETDGLDFVRPLGSFHQPFAPDFRERLRACLGNPKGSIDLDVALVERELTELHAQAVERFLDERLMTAQQVDLIGFHGQTLCHRPEERFTLQIGDGALLAELTGIPVVNDFRQADVRAGGQGAPLVPLYHCALVAELPKPAAIINIGGVANITWVGNASDDDLLAFDMGPGNALIDDWVWRNTGEPYDKDGALAAQGHVDEMFVERFLDHAYFSLRPPKSLDRDAFKEFIPNASNVTDGAATLTMMTVRAMTSGLLLLPDRPHTLYLTGGGRHNATIRQWLGEQTGLPIALVDVLGWNGDALEAEAFAYLAVRSKLGLFLSVPGTTGVSQPMTGGRYHGIEEKARSAITG